MQNPDFKPWMQALWFVLEELRIWVVVGPCGGANPPSPKVVQGGSQVPQLNNNCAEILAALVFCKKGWGWDKNACVLNFLSTKSFDTKPSLCSIPVLS